MSALTEARDTREIAAGGVHYTREFTVATGSTVYAGAITVIGRAENTAAAGETVTTRSGMFLYNPVSSGAISVTDVNKKCYVADDQTVTLTSGSSAVVAGVVRDVTAGGVVTEIGNGPL